MKTKLQDHARLKDVAAQAGVSPVTAGRVLLGSGSGSVRVGKATAEKIRRIAEKLNYSPNIIARQLAGKKSQVIGVIVDSYSPQIDVVKLSEMEREAARRGYRFMVGQSHGELDRLRAYAQDFSARGVEGIICLSHQYPETGSQVSQIFTRFKNVVFIRKPDSPDENICFVDLDRADGIRQAFSFLTSKGRKRIALLVRSFLTCTLQERLQGYLHALREHEKAERLVCDLSELSGSDLLDEFNEPDQEIITRAVEKIIRELRADAVLAENDIMACRVIKAARLFNSRVPQDLSVVGFDNLQVASVFEPALTTLDQRSKESSQTAINTLLDLVEGKDLPIERRQVILKPKLIVRESA